MPLNKLFATDEDAEKKGIIIDYGDFQVRIRRSGGANKDFEKVLNRLTRPHRRAIQTDSIDPALADAISQEVFARTVVVDWEGHLDDDENGNPITEKEFPCTPENVMSMFKAYPDFYADIVEQARKTALFRKHILDTDSGN